VQDQGEHVVAQNDNTDSTLGLCLRRLARHQRMLRTNFRRAAPTYARRTRLSAAQEAPGNLLRHEAATRRSRSDVLRPQAGHVQVNPVKSRLVVQFRQKLRFTFVKLAISMTFQPKGCRKRSRQTRMMRRQ